ncbi:MAG: ribosomal-processing cysteine protease Prp [Ruminococcaceae bacterium]|nr:ribosomal-processing cysteine protease Prp [Oscillospiraceae bacterium]
MITISLFKDQNHKVKGFTVEGHAGYGEHGTDIVCAAVTTVTMTTVNGLTDVVNISLTPEVREGFLSCSLPDKLSETKRREADVLLESMVLTLQNLVSQYGEYIRLQEE